MMEDLYYRHVIVTKVYDGDTITADVDLGYGVWAHKQKYRLEGINTPEIRTRNAEEKQRGYAARDWLRERIQGANEVVIQTVRKGKYGRWLAVVFADGVNLNEELLKTGHAVPYL